MAVGLRDGPVQDCSAGASHSRGRDFRASHQALPQPDELLLDRPAAEVGVEDGGRVDEVGRFSLLSGVEIGQRQAVPGVEPEGRPGREIPARSL